MAKFSERYSTLGGTAGSAMKRTIGKSPLDPWHVFLREAVQNSWDARLDGRLGINFGAHAFELTDSQRTQLAKEILVDLQDMHSLHGLRQALDAPNLNVLLTWDSGTKGLGGPVDASLAGEPGIPTDFTDFIFNIGQPENHSIGGGTFGFGKAVFYRASEVSTCIVYSQTSNDDGIENRLIAVSVQEPFSHSGFRYTGRHWWGDSGVSGNIAPFIGSKARRLAESLGLVKFGEHETGTAIAVLSPVMQGYSGSVQRERIVASLIDAATKWTWPHMLSTVSRSPDIKYFFEVDRGNREVLSPTLDEQIGPFARIYEEAMAPGSTSHREAAYLQQKTIQVGTRSRNMGTLWFAKPPSHPSSPYLGDFNGCVALMRGPRLIVNYESVASHVEGLEQFGVFVAAENDEVEKLFASAEPPTHDAWMGDDVGIDQGRPVKSALSKLRESFRPPKSQAKLDNEGSFEVSGGGLEQASLALGRAISGTSKGFGAGRRRPSGNTRSTREQVPRATVNAIESTIPDADGARVTFRVQLSAAGIAKEIVVVARPQVLNDGGAPEPIARLDVNRRPRILGWSTLAGETTSSSAETKLANEDTELLFCVWQPLSMTVILNVEVQ